MKKKCLAIGVILLFIGVAVAPSINLSVVKASNDNDLVEVTTQACGINGFGNTTVKLTRQQYENLEQYLVEFRARLYQTTTREEAVPIFKDAVVELNKYGLLPKGMSVEKAQRLVIGLYQNTKLLKFLEKLSDKSENLLLQEGNKLCLIYGEAQNNTYFQGPVSWAIYNGLYKLFLISHDIAYRFIQFHIFAYIFESISMFMFLLKMINGFKTYYLSLILRNLPYIGAVIYYGGVEENPVSLETFYHPAGGSIWTNGLFGKGQWNESFYGKLSSLSLWYFFIDFYPGVYGFTGLRLSSNSSDVYFGFALNVNVSSDHP